mgnify:CR=1 FL=1
MQTLIEKMKALSSAEDFLLFFGVPFEARVVQVNRLHILKRFHQYLHRSDGLPALDAIVRVKLRQEIRALQRQLGVTTVMVTHDQEEAFAVADRIVVMNQGSIEQVGDAMQVYREPRSLFVADFVGRINVLPAHTVEGGGLRVGRHVFACEHAHAPGRDVRVYLRPEDVLARPLPPGDPNVFDAQIEKIEFMGPYCLVRVSGDALGEHRLTVYLSLNYLAEAQLAVGSRLPLRLVPERMRVFE